ncbi:MAG: hypothetical protein H6Q15_1958 [Bacteroidetes bacterium]|nr:hypothetical protein [Bacteroidota bacterium]
MPKLIFIQPSLYEMHSKKIMKGKKNLLPGLALPLLAAYAPSHWEVDIAKEFKDRGKIVFTGGLMSTLMPELCRDFSIAL